MARVAAALACSLVTLAYVGCTTEGQAPFPPRPVEVAVDKLMPCTMLDESQQDELGLRDATPRTVTVNGSPSTICTWITDGRIGYNLQTIPVGVELALNEPAARTVDVNGFGAVQSVSRGVSGGGPVCQITIDAAPGRVIRIQTVASPRPPLPTDEQMCRLATDAASMVMTTVIRGTG